MTPEELREHLRVLFQTVLNNATAPLGTPCAGYYDPTPGAIAPGSTTECPRLFPELYTGGVAPHGIAKYNYDSANPNPNKFPPYFDESVFLGEFGAYEKADMTSRAKWTAAVVKEAESRGFSWAYWEFGAGFGAYDRQAKTWREPLMKALIPSK